ncbi:MAG TPA: membrane protein insertase YidC [Kofleriaceae bacterium]
MQEQGKRLLLAVALGLGVILLWNAVVHKDEPAPPAQHAQTTGSGSAAGSALAPSPAMGWLTQVGAPEPAGGDAAKPGEAAKPAEGTDITLPYDHFVATFSSSCGGLVSWKLIDPRYQRDATKGELLPPRAHITDDGKPVPAGDPRLANLPACGAFDVNFVGGSTFVVPRGATWTGEKVSPTEVRYRYASDELTVVKDFQIFPDDYVVRMSVQVTVRPPAGLANERLAVSVYAFQDPAELKNGSSRVAARAWSSATLRDDTVITTDVEAVMKDPRFEPSREHGGVVHWTGFDHPFLLAGYAPQPGDKIDKQTYASSGTKGLPRGFMRTDILYQATPLKSGDTLSKTIVGYLGPKNYDDLQAADKAAGFPTGFNTVIDFGWFAFIGKPLLWLLQKFWEFTGSWGVAIVLLTIFVKLITLYWTTKSMRSMKAMAAIAPQIKAMQTKYADDKQRQQTETMALYKEHGVNPVAGCLPILLQMPIWIALYRMLANAGELYLQPFIPGWIDDLTNTDPYYVLPAVLFISMFVQARLQPASVDSTQQKFLQYGMPIMFGIMAFIFPSGLSLYMLTNNILSMLHSIYMNKFDKKSLASAAQLKKNQELVAEAIASAKAAGGAGGKPAPGKAAPKTSGGPQAKRVIDAKATEVTGDGDGDGEASDDAPEAAAATPGAARNRPRRKKRRR